MSVYLWSYVVGLLLKVGLHKLGFLLVLYFYASESKRECLDLLAFHSFSLNLMNIFHTLSYSSYWFVPAFLFINNIYLLLPPLWWQTTNQSAPSEPFFLALHYPSSLQGNLGHLPMLWACNFFLASVHLYWHVIDEQNLCLNSYNISDFKWIRILLVELCYYFF